MLMETIHISGNSGHLLQLGECGTLWGKREQAIHWGIELL